MKSTAPVIALVGHCGPDRIMLQSAVSHFVPGAELAMINDEAGLGSLESSEVLLLVNRLLDGSFGTDSGVELIRRVAAGDAAPRCMLVSNFPESQAEAVAAGALQGFGKSDLYDPNTGELLLAALQSNRSTARDQPNG